MQAGKSKFMVTRHHYEETMMTKTTLASILSTAAFVLTTSSVAQAACTDPLLSGSTISGQLVCANKPGQAGDPNQRWSEIHNPASDGGEPVTLGEHGRGTTDPAGSYDAEIGTWRYSGTSITYNYTGDGSYTWDLHGTDGTTPTSFCNGPTEIAEIYTVTGIPAATATNPCNW